MSRYREFGTTAPTLPDFMLEDRERRLRRRQEEREDARLGAERARLDQVGADILREYPMPGEREPEPMMTDPDLARPPAAPGVGPMGMYAPSTQVGPAGAFNVRPSAQHLADTAGGIGGALGSAERLRLSLGIGARQKVHEQERRGLGVRDFAEGQRRFDVGTAASLGVASLESGAAGQKDRYVTTSDGRVIDTLREAEIAPAEPRPIVAGNRAIDPVTGKEIAPQSPAAGPAYEGVVKTDPESGTKLYWSTKDQGYLPIKEGALGLTDMQFISLPEAQKQQYVDAAIERIRGEARGGAARGNTAPEGTRVRMANGGTMVKRGGKWVEE